MRNTIKKKQLSYLVQLLTYHVESQPEDIGRWIAALKIAYRDLVTMDNMGTHEFTHKYSVTTLDTIFENLRNSFNKNDLFFPETDKYYK